MKTWEEFLDEAYADGVCEFAQAIIAAYNAKNGITSEANGQIK